MAKSNLSRCVSNARSFDFIMDRFKTSFVYFSTPQKLNRELSLFDGIAEAAAYDSVIYETRSLDDPDALGIPLSSVDKKSTNVNAYDNRHIQYGIVVKQIGLPRRMILKADFVKIKPLLEKFTYEYNFERKSFTNGSVSFFYEFVIKYFYEIFIKMT